jgi:hypothetical protein
MRLLTLAALAGLLLGPGSASAMVINPGFDSGLTGWNTIGDFSVETGSYGPAGDPKLVLTTAPGTLAALGTGAVAADPDVIGLLGISAATLAGVEPASSVEGAAVTQQFTTVNAVTDIAFEYQLFSEETNWSAPYADFVIFHVRNLAGTFSSTVLITDAATEDTAGNFSVSVTQFQSETSVRSITMPLNGADTYIFGIAVFDVTDAEFDSAVALDNFALIPEPRGALLLAAGLLGLTLAGRSRSNG